jgi:hypothetical protein
MKRSALILVAALAACSGSKPVSKAPAPAASLLVSPLASANAARAAAHAAQAPARSHLMGTISRKAIGPFVARGPTGGIVTWIVAAERGGGQELVVVPMGGDGAPFGEPHVVAKVPQEATSLVVRATGGSKGGWLVAWSALLDRGESLTVLGVQPDGTARGAPSDVQRTSDHLKWVDIVPTAHGATCIWAEETTAGDANILAAPLDTDGKPRAMPVRVVRGVMGWGAVRAGVEDGVAMAVVSVAHDDKSGAGSLSWLRLDGEGRPLAGPIAVGGKPTVSGDVDVVPVPDGWLLAWTDRTGEDAQVVLATVDASGHVKGPRRAMDTVGGAALVGLASGPAGVALAWEEPRGRARSMRALHLASVSVDGDPVAQSVTSVEVASRSLPELAATAHGFALLAAARACTADTAPDACAGPVVPTFLRFDARLAATQAEPMFIGDARAEAALAWGLRCEDDRCVALAATSDAPTPVFTVDLAPRTSPFAARTVPPRPADAPRVTGVETIASGQPYADVHTTRVAEATLVATLTSAVDVAPHGEGKSGKHGREGENPRARGATIVARPFDDRGLPLGPANLVTSRALSVGGVAIAAGAKPEDGAAVAWVARDDGDPQVHVGHVDHRGHRTSEVQLTTAKGDASDVALAWAGDGWIVAWVDTRDGNGEVYATKVDRDLNRVAREERITHAPGDAGDVALAVRGDVAWLAWADPRESPREGMADIYAATLHGRDAKPAGDEVRVLATAAHSRSPELVPAPGGVLVAWIEDAPSELDAPGAAMVARIDASGHVAAAPSRLPLAGKGNPSTVALGAAGDVVHVIVARSEHDEVTLDAVVVPPDPSDAPRPFPLLDLDAPATFEVALAIEGDVLFFDDVGAAPGSHRVRRADVAWRR